VDDGREGKEGAKGCHFGWRGRGFLGGHGRSGLVRECIGEMDTRQVVVSSRIGEGGTERRRKIRASLS
jgi:hypothetical protein